MPDIHIHINANDSGQPARSPRLGLEDKMRKCYDWQSLHALMREFHQVGITIKETSEHRFILCRVVNGEPLTENIIDDYVFLGAKSRMHEEILPRHMNIIVEFVLGNTGAPYKPAKPATFAGPKLYGPPILIRDEQNLSECQHIQHIGKLINE